MAGVLIFLSTSLVLLSSTCRAFLNIEELQNSKYGLEILNEPVLLKEVGLENVVQVASVHGQKYQCDLPIFKAHEKVEDGSREDQNGKNATELLKSLNKRCITHHKDWWTYEVCFGQHIMQYHEEDFQIVGEKIPLGYYNSTATRASYAEKTEPKNTKKKRLYHVDWYTNGSVCDLTGKPRTAQIRFQCDPTELEETILSLSEPETCAYVITVSTKLLCSIPAYSPPSPPMARSITCSPALSQEQFDSYNAFKEPNKQEAENQIGEVGNNHDKSSGSTEETDVFGNFNGDQFMMTTSVRSKENSYISMIGRRLYKNMDKQIKKYEKYLDKGQEQPETISETDKAWVEETKKYNDELSQKFDLVTAKKMNMEMLLKTKLELLGVDKAELEGIINGDPGDTEEDEMNDEDLEEEDGEEHDGRKLLKKMRAKKVNQRKKIFDRIKELKETTRNMEEEELLASGGKEFKLADEIYSLYKDKEYQTMLVWKREEDLKNELAKFISSIRKHVPEPHAHTENDKGREKSRQTRAHILTALHEVSGYLEKGNNDLKKEITAEKDIVNKLNKQLKQVSIILEELEEPKKIHSAMEKCKSLIFQFTETRFKRHEDVDEMIENVGRQKTKYKMKWLVDLVNQDVGERVKKARKTVKLESLNGESDNAEDEIGEADDAAESKLAFGKHKVDKLVSRVRQMLSALSGTADKISAKKEKVDTETEVPEGKDASGGSNAKADNNKKDSKNTVSVQIRKIKSLKGNQGWYGENEDSVETEDNDDENEEGIKSATKQMESMIKQQLKDAGIVPSADIKVKIYTTRDPLSKVVDDPGGAQLLTEDETMQFKDLLMGLLGGGKASLKEKERQQKLQNNYNLVWGASGFQKVQTEDSNDEENKAGLIYRGV